MKRRVPAIAASALAAAMALAFSPTANAAAKVPIRTYLETWSVDWTGIGHGISDHRMKGSEKVALRPHLAFNSSLTDVFAGHSSSSRDDLAGGREYTRTGNDPWTVTKLSAKTLARYANNLNPYTTLAKFKALHGVQRVTARHYRVTGTYAQIGSFLTWEYGIKGNDFKPLTINFWVDSSGRPTRITLVTRDSVQKLSITETFGHYNKPVVIRVP